MRGASAIAAERQRQIDVEGFSDTHDDLNNSNGQLVDLAMCYLTEPAIREQEFGDEPPVYYPWNNDFWWKPVPGNRIRELVKAGALIAAEIDRLNRRTMRKG